MDNKYPLPEGVTDAVVNMTQLAHAFNVSTNTVSKWVARGLPVLTKGENGQAYEFQLSECWAWYQGRQEEARRKKEEGDRAAQQMAMAFLNDDAATEDDGWLSPREIRELTEAHIKRNQLDEQRGRLVRAERVSRLLEDIVIIFGSGLDTLPDWAEREFGLTNDQVDRMQKRVDQIRIDMRLRIEREALGNSAEIVEAETGTQKTLGL